MVERSRGKVNNDVCRLLWMVLTLVDDDGGQQFCSIKSCMWWQVELQETSMATVYDDKSRWRTEVATTKRDDL